MGQRPTTLPLPLVGGSLKKLGKQGPLAPPFPDGGAVALSVTAAAVPAPPEGEPSMCAAKSLRKAKSRLPLWGRCPRRGRRGLTHPLRARAFFSCTGAAFSRRSRLPARSVLNGPHWGPGPQGANCQGCNPRESRAQALGKLYVGSPFSCSVNLRGQPTGCPRFFYAAPSSRVPG